jgi:integrase
MSTALDNVATFPVPAEVAPAETTDDQRKKRQQDRDGLHKRRGIWHFKIKVSGRWREMSTHTTKYQDARKYRDKTLRDQEEGRLPTDKAKWRFAQAAEHWLENRKMKIAPNTWRIEKHRVQRLKDKFADMRLCQITSDDISEYQMKRLDKISAATINSETKVLRLILKSAKLWTQLAGDYKPLPESEEGPGRVLTPAEEARLFDVAMNDENASAVYYAAIVAANTTMRGCELKRLKIQDVDLANRTITIRRKATKTRAGCRIIPLNEKATWAMSRLLERATLLKATKPEHYLFPGSPFRRTRDASSHKGSGYDPTSHQVSWRTSWRNLLKKAGLPHMRFHDLRHHCITRLAEEGVPDHTLMAISGHVSKAMLDHYSHVRLEARRTAVAALDTVQPPVTGQSATSEKRIVVSTQVSTQSDCDTEFYQERQSGPELKDTAETLAGVALQDHRG